MEPLTRLHFDAARLFAEHPPKWRDRNKRIVAEISSPPGSTHRGRIHYNRWSAMDQPPNAGTAVSKCEVEIREDVFDYSTTGTGAHTVAWHVNFADPLLFGYYGSGLFAQDEMQVAEHPALGALKEALDAGNHTARTVEGGRPTPVLVMGVERRCQVATDRKAAEGRPEGLYGNAFSHASEEALRRATRRIDPPTITNIIAIAAPRGGHGRYDRRTIEQVLGTAFTGFRAAVLESRRHRGLDPQVVVHTGFWGCGAFGGHRELMPMLQVLAAQMAGVDRLVFHAVDAAGAGHAHAALGRIERDLSAAKPIETDRLIDRIAAMGFQWGVSDGN